MLKLRSLDSWMFLCSSATLRADEGVIGLFLEWHLAGKHGSEKKILASSLEPILGQNYLLLQSLFPFHFNCKHIIYLFHFLLY